MIKHIFIVLCISASFKCSYTQDVSTFINSKKSINVIDDRYISIVIDPLILLSGLNISSHTLTLAKHLSPAFVRIQGLSTSQLSLSSDLLPVTTNKEKSKDNNNVGSIATDSISAMKLTVTPFMWKSLNQWLVSANLTPVFALSDKDRTNDAWNPTSVALPLMALANKENNSCFWEIATDLPNKTLKQYADDVTVLRHILDAFPGSRNSWAVVGGEMGHCALPPAATAVEGAEIARKLLKRIERNVDAVNWAPKSGDINFPAKITKANPLISKHNPSIWTTAPRNPQPTSFKDALIWAQNLGETAINGYNVIFRQPKIREFVQLTPAFWVSLFHKKLMGNNVLEVKTLNNKKTCYIFAHCTKNINYLAKNEAVTIFVVNMEEREMNITNKFMGTILKNNDIHSYILTSNNDDSSEIYLNGEPLTISDLHDRKIEFNPQPRSVKSSKSICLNLPAKSIGFFVIPISGLSACNHDNHNTENTRISKSTESETDTNNNSIISMNTSHEKDSNEKYYMNLEENESKIDTIPTMNRVHETVPNKIYYKSLKEENREPLQDKSKAEMNKSNYESAMQDDITITKLNDHSKQENALEIGQKTTDLKKLLTVTSSSSNQVPNMEISQETLLSSENSNEYNSEMNDGHIKQTITEKLENDNSMSQIDNKVDNRKKRDLELISFEIPNIEIETQARRIRKTEDEFLNFDPLSEFSCGCKKDGKICTCKINLIHNLLQKFLGSPHDFLENIEDFEPEIVTEKILNAFQLPLSSTNMESTTIPPKDVQDIKKLLEQYQTEIKNIITSIKKNDNRNKINTEIENSNENKIPRYRLKRSLSPDSKNENIRKKQIKQIENKYWLRNKRQSKTNNVQEKPDCPNAENVRSFLLQQQLNMKKQMDEQLNNYHIKMADSNILGQKRQKRSVRSKKCKREISESLDSVDKTNDDNRTTKFNKKNRFLKSEEDKTKEVDTFLNEISKEGKNIPNYLKTIQEDVYLVKPHLNDEIELKIFSKNKMPNEVENKIAETAESNLIPPIENKITKLVLEDTSSNNSDEYVELPETESTGTTEYEDAPKEGLVDNVFHTMFEFLNDFHKKIIHYLHYLSR